MMRAFCHNSLAFSLTLLPCMGTPTAQPAVQSINLILGTQAIGGKYQFSEKPAHVESAHVAHEMGATCFKFALRLPNDNASIQTVTDLVQKDAGYRAVLEMPFRDYLMWVDASEEGAWTKGLTPVQAVREYRQVYELTSHLLRSFSGTGKSFYLGHWEGDNMLRPEGIHEAADAAMKDARRVRGFTDWLKIRQQAVDDAKRDTAHSGVHVWHYTEVNHPTITLLYGRPSLADQVLPYVPVDFVSYSAYDSQHDPALMRRVLEDLQARLMPKAGITGKRVFIGEYGFWTRKEGRVQNTPEQQDQRSLRVIETALEWGCPFVLYWQLYNNELDADGRHRGFWMIDDKGIKQPIYQSHLAFYQWARAWLGETAAAGLRAPSEAEFRKAALEFIQQRQSEPSK